MARPSSIIVWVHNMRYIIEFAFSFHSMNGPDANYFKPVWCTFKCISVNKPKDFAKRFFFPSIEHVQLAGNINVFTLLIHAVHIIKYVISWWNFWKHHIFKRSKKVFDKHYYNKAKQLRVCYSVLHT